MMNAHSTTTRAALLVLTVAAPVLAGPYAPPAGQDGSTAVHMDEASLVAWATGCEVQYGEAVDANWRTPEEALGPAEGNIFDILCLGRGGQATLTFAKPISDRPGADLAVFENAVNDYFLELAYVEVSSDGVNFFRFDNDSLTPSPVSAFGGLDATDVAGLAGKYRAGYGTPFDLADLAGRSDRLNVHGVTHVRIVDVVGDGTSLDTDGNAIFDPYPTTGSAGFDLDAIGVAHEAYDGDTDLDGDVDLTDFGRLATNYGRETGMARAEGDADGDGDVDLTDFGILATEYGSTSQAPAAVPEPATVWLMLSVLGSMVRPGPGRRGRRERT